MNCRRFRSLADEYLDMTLSGKKLQHFLGHEKVCARCREYLNARKKLIRLITEKAETAPEVDVVSEVMERVAAVPVKKPASPYRVPFVLGGCITVFTALLLLWFGLSGIPASFSRMDIVKAVSLLFRVPENLRNDLEQVQALIRAFILVAQTFFDLLFRLVRSWGEPVMTGGGILIVLMSSAALLLRARIRKEDLGTGRKGQ